MARASKASRKTKDIVALVHEEASRKNIPTAELQATAELLEEQQPLGPVRYARARPLAEGERRSRDGDLDPQIVWNGARIRLTTAQVEQLHKTGEVEIGDAQLVWRGKDQQDWSDLIVQAPQLFVQEKVHPKAIIDDLKRHADTPKDETPDLFADFNGLDPEARTEFYKHEGHWTNRMVLGDSLQVMASLAEREQLRGKVQCIYFDPPYGIKFNSNWQVSTRLPKVRDGDRSEISREPEQVKAFRDTWRDGIHSYLTYLRDRLTLARELLTDSGSIFVQIGDENVHRVRAVMDEVFGLSNSVALIAIKKTTGQTSELLPGALDFILYYAKDIHNVKSRTLYTSKFMGGAGTGEYHYARKSNLQTRRLSLAEFEGGPIHDNDRVFSIDNLTSQKPPGKFPVQFEGKDRWPLAGFWKTGVNQFPRLVRADRVWPTANSLKYKRYLDDFPVMPIANFWDDVSSGASASDPKIYVVQTTARIIQRCILLSTDPGVLVLDPTCGSGTTAAVAEQWGRRWITIDTSRVALALARTRLMAARYPYYFLADSPEGRKKEQHESGREQPLGLTQGDIRHGFVYGRVPHVMLQHIANNEQIDKIFERWQTVLEPLQGVLNSSYGGKPFEHWEIPLDAGTAWPAAAKEAHEKWWEGRIMRQREIDASIAKSADVELLYDRPFTDASRVRVAGPFTVESLSPHRMVRADAAALFCRADEMADHAPFGGRAPPTDFARMILDNLLAAGVHSQEKRDKITFTSITPWPGAKGVCAEGCFLEGDGEHAVERRAAIFLGPEFGTLGRSDLVAAAREATEARFDVLIACAFSYDAHAADFAKLGVLPILKAKMNPDLHMSDELKTTGKGNLFVIFGEPDVEIKTVAGDALRVRVKGIDVYDPNTGEIRSDDTDGIAAWFIDTDYNEESFFVRHAYFLGANDPYKSLKTALRVEIDEAAWATLYSDTSRPFPRPTTGRIAVKVINHFGDEVMKVFSV